MSEKSMNMTRDVLYTKGRDDELARHVQVKLRKIYSSKDLDTHTLDELDEARKGLVSFKCEDMKRLDWKYLEDVRYLFDLIITNRCTQDTVNLFEMIQMSYRTILMNNDTQELEWLHLALVEAVHEWGFKYRFEAEVIKKANEAQWRAVIKHIANKLADEVEAYTKERKVIGNRAC